MWETGSQAGPEAIRAADIYDVSLHTGQEQRHKRPCAIVDTKPTHAEGLVPFGTVVIQKTASTSDTSIVEKEVDPSSDEIVQREVSLILYKPEEE